MPDPADNDGPCDWVDATWHTWFRTALPNGAHGRPSYVNASTGHLSRGGLPADLPQPLRRISAVLPDHHARVITDVLSRPGGAGARILVWSLRMVADKLAYNNQPRHRVLTAGRPGSWESAHLRSIATARAKCVQPPLQVPTAMQRQSLTALTSLISNCVNGPVYYELAGTLAALAAPVIDKAGGWDGWVKGDADIDDWARVHVRPWLTGQPDD